MPYTKTNWQDNVTPLSATNMNKIEQGIADATATADAAVPKTSHLSAGTDLNTVTTSGFYRLENNHANAPVGVSYGQLLVCHGGGDTIFQIITGYNNNKMYFRHGNPPNIGGPGSWGPWIEFITSAGGQTINGKLSLGNLTGEKLYIYENGPTKAGLGFNMTAVTNELAIFHSSPTGSQGRITFGKRLDDGSFVKTATMFSDGKLLVSEGAYGKSARLQVGDGKYGLGAESSRLYLVSEFGEVWTADAAGNPIGRVWDSSLLRNNNGLLELNAGGAWVPVGGSFIPYSERRGASGQPSISPANTWVTLVNLNMRGRLERVNFRAFATGEGNGSYTATFRVTVDGKVVWQPAATGDETSDQILYYLGGYDADEQADYLYFNSNFKLEAQVNTIPSGGAPVGFEVFYRQAI